MDDLISRQAAIDVLNKHSVMFGFHLPHEFHEVKEEIRGLSSAQPTQTNKPNALKSLDCVSRQAAIDVIDSYEVDAPDYMQGWAVKLIEAIKGDIRGLISELPSAQPKPKTGKWIRHDEVRNVYGGTYVECSECGEKYVVQHIEDEKYCRNCGADMRGEQDE